MDVIHHRFLRSPLSAAVIAALSVSPLHAQENTPLGTVTVTAQQAATKAAPPTALIISCCAGFRTVA